MKRNADTTTESNGFLRAKLRTFSRRLSWKRLKQRISMSCILLVILNQASSRHFESRSHGPERSGSRQCILFGRAKPPPGLAHDEKKFNSTKQNGLSCRAHGLRNSVSTNERYSSAYVYTTRQGILIGRKFAMQVIAQETCK